MRAKERRRYDRLKEEARRFALNATEDPSTLRRKLQKRLIYDFDDLFYEDAHGTIHRKASDQGEVAISPPLIMPAAGPVAEPVADAASGLSYPFLSGYYPRFDDLRNVQFVFMDIESIKSTKQNPHGKVNQIAGYKLNMNVVDPDMSLREVISSFRPFNIVIKEHLTLPNSYEHVNRIQTETANIVSLKQLPSALDAVFLRAVLPGVPGVPDFVPAANMSKFFSILVFSILVCLTDCQPSHPTLRLAAS